MMISRCRKKKRKKEKFCFFGKLLKIPVIFYIMCFYIPRNHQSAYLKQFFAKSQQIGRTGSESIFLNFF